MKKTMEFRIALFLITAWLCCQTLMEYSLDQDIYDCIGRVHAKPFSRYFEEQVDAGGGIVWNAAAFFFSKKEISGNWEFAGELYDEKICRRAEQVLFEQMRKYQVYFSRDLSNR